MKKNDAHIKLISEMLKKSERVSLADAMETLGVSESTARRLFCRLEEEGYAIRYHGGIRAAVGGIFDYSYDDMKTKYVPEKKLLAKMGAALVGEGDTVYIDAGTTMKYLTFALAARCEAGELGTARFFTNSLTDFGILRDRSDISLIGGSYRTKRKDFCGYIACEMLSRLHFTKCFVGADGYNPASGFTTTDFETAALCDTAIANSEKCYILMNSEKFMKTSLVSFGRSAPDLTVITDKATEAEVANSLEAAGVKIIIAKPRQKL